MYKPCIRLLLPAVLAGLGSAALAQTPPDAGALRQQVEPERPLPLPPAQAPLPASPAESATPGSGVTVNVTQFRFSGNTLLSDAALQPAVAGYINRSLGFDELQQAVASVATLYRQSGWVVRAFLPHQEVTDGVVLIQIDEARFGAVQIEGLAPQRLRSSVWHSMVTAAQRVDEPLSAPALDRALLLLDDLPGVSAAGSLAPGQQPGQTDLLLRLDDEPLVTGSIGGDNYGMRSTGSERGVATVAFNSPFRFGDRLTSDVIYADGNSYGRLGYTAAVGGSGLRIGANVSNMDYQLVGREFAAFDAQGSSLSWGLEANYPLLRSRERNVYVVAHADHRRFDNEANGATTAKYTVDAMGIGLVANRYDAWGGGGATEGNLTLSGGHVGTSDATAPRADRSGGGFMKARLGVSRQQLITGGLSAYVAWRGQWADTNLDSSEKFHLGGVNGVRAYPANEGGGAWGQLATVELRQRLGTQWRLTGFFDYGQVRQYAQQRDVRGQPLTVGSDNTLDYRGYGLSLGWVAPFGLQLNASWAHRLGSNPHSLADGRDQDGSLRKDRFWLSIALPFEFGVPAARALAPQSAQP